MIQGEDCNHTPLPAHTALPLTPSFPTPGPSQGLLYIQGTVYVSEAFLLSRSPPRPLLDDGDVSDTKMEVMDDDPESPGWPVVETVP